MVRLTIIFTLFCLRIAFLAIALIPAITMIATISMVATITIAVAITGLANTGVAHIVIAATATKAVAKARSLDMMIP